MEEGVAVIGDAACSLRPHVAAGTPVHAGVDYQVRGRVRSVEGRKLSSEVAMLDPDGTTVAEAVAVWIAIDPSMFAAGS